MGKEEKWHRWSGEFMAGSGIKVFDVLMQGNTKTLEDESYESKYRGVTNMLKIINKIAYNELIFFLKDTVCLHISE